MSDRAVENAETMKKQLLERRKAIQAELIGIDDQIGRIDRFLKDWQLFADFEEPTTDHTSVIMGSDNGNETSLTHTKKPARPRNSSKEEVAKVARDIIRERGEPIMRDELFDLLTSRGLTIQGKDPRMVLSTMLWRMRERVARVKGGGYWPADIPNAAAGYDPATAHEMDGVLNTPEGEIADADVAESEFDDERSERQRDIESLI